MFDNYGTNLRAPKVDIHDFSLVPRSEVPRSSFIMEHQHKTTFSASQLIPVYCQEILPGDSFNVEMSAFCRLATPLYPLMDNMDLESFFFFVPNRLVWEHWQNFMGEQNNPTDSISYAIPQIVSPTGGFAAFSLFDYFGLPTVGQVGAGNTVSINALPIRAYSLIVQEWFRDQNLDTAMATGTTGTLAPGAKFLAQSDDGPDLYSNYPIFTVRKRHDYFTSCLPWTQKGNPVTLPLGSTAVVKTSATNTVTGTQNALQYLQVSGSAIPGSNPTTLAVAPGGAAQYTTTTITAGGGIYPSNLYADLSTATAATINSIRLAFQTQRLLERDARGGTRYPEHLLSHWGVTSDDLRMFRPELLNHGKTPVNIAPVPQTSATNLTGGSSPMGTLSAVGTAVARHGFSHSFKEHGYVLGLVAIRNDKIYQQGLKRLWKRSTRYDFYLPVFAHLGEDSVFNYEIYCDGSANDSLTFGYQERWATYRYNRSYTTGFFRSTNPTPLDAWHLAQKFTALPALNSTFLADDLGTTLQRNLAATTAANNQQLICDFFFREKAARLMPAYSVPGLVDHF